MESKPSETHRIVTSLATEKPFLKMPLLGHTYTNSIQSDISVQTAVNAFTEKSILSRNANGYFYGLQFQKSLPVTICPIRRNSNACRCRLE